MGVDDPITDAVLSDSAYERVRVRRFGWFKQSVARKLALQSYLLLVLAAVLPVVALLPSDVKQAYFAGRVADAAPKVALVALVAVAVIAMAGGGLAVIGALRVWTGDDFDEHTAHSLLTFEDLCSVSGLATGGTATVATYVFVVMGFGGVETLRAWMAVGGGNPYAPSGLGLDLEAVAVMALCLAVCLRLVSTYLSARGPVTSDTDV